MLVAKTTDKRGDPHYWEVLAAGRVQFDPRDGWVLCGHPIGARPRKQELKWLHSGDERFEWVRRFEFGEPAEERPAEASLTIIAAQ